VELSVRSLVSETVMLADRVSKCVGVRDRDNEQVSVTESVSSGDCERDCCDTDDVSDAVRSPVGLAVWLRLAVRVCVPVQVSVAVAVGVIAIVSVADAVSSGVGEGE
jgi:hypothetical protein